MNEEQVVIFGVVAIIVALIILFIRHRNEDKEEPKAPPVSVPIEPTPPVEPPIPIEPPVELVPTPYPLPVEVIIPVQPVPVPYPLPVEPTPVPTPTLPVFPLPPPLPEGIRLWEDGRWWFNNEFYATVDYAIAAKVDYERRVKEREENLRRGEEETVNTTYTGILFASRIIQDDADSAYLFAMSMNLKLQKPNLPNLYYGIGLLSGTFHDIARLINHGELCLIAQPADFIQNYNGILKPYIDRIFQNGHL